MKKITVTLFLPMLLIFSCEPCGKGHNPRRKLTGFDIIASDNKAGLLSKDSVFIQGDTAFFRMQFEVVTVAANVPSISFISSATDCSPMEPYLIHSIDSMAVITIDSWDAGHPALSDISDLVTAKRQLSYAGPVDTTFHGFARNINNDPWFYYGSAWFGIHTLPVSRKGRFYVRLWLSNGTEHISNLLKLVE